MMRKLGLSTAVAALLLGCQDAELPTQPQHEAASVSASTATAIWHQRFAPTTGRLMEERVEIPLPEGLQEATLRVVNGTARGTDRVSTATVRFDGEVVVGPSDLSQNVAGKLVAVRMTGTRAVLNVQLSGRAGAFLDISLERGAPVGPQGGTLSLDGGDVAVVVPRGAVTGDVVITADPVPADPDNGILTVYDFGPDGSRFAQPLTITLPYDPARLPAGASPALFWKDDAGRWQPLDNPRFDAAVRTVTGEIDHFTDIGVLVGNATVCPGDPSAFQDFASAYASVAAYGSIFLCPGTHRVQDFTIRKPVAIHGAGAGVTIVDAGGPNRAFTIADAPGLVSIAAMTFQGYTGRTQAVAAEGAYEGLSISRVVFANTPASHSAVLAGPSTSPDAGVVIRNSIVSGGESGLFVVGVRFDLSQNIVGGQSLSNIQIQNEARGDIVGNTVSECGRMGCIRVRWAGEVRIADNQVRTTARHAELPAIPGFPQGVQFGIVADGTLVTVENNVVEGLGPITDPASVGSYPINDMGIVAWSNHLRPSVVVVRNNRVSGVAKGIYSFRAGNSPAPQFPVSLSGSGNVVTRTQTAVGTSWGGRLRLQLNDLTDYHWAVRHLSVPEGEEPIAAGDLACNWWGSTAGPGVISGDTLAASAYTPWATSPIAGTGRGC
jgi:hypothetical protein